MATNNDGICDYCKKPIEKDHDRTLVISPTLRVHKKLYHGDCYVDFIAINQIFAELDKMIEELDDSLRTIGEITLDAEKYEALKKQHGVPR